MNRNARGRLKILQKFSSGGHAVKLYARYFIRLFVAVLGLIVYSQSVLAAPIELSLDESVALALKNNPEIKIANSDRTKSYWAVKEAKAGKGLAVDYTHADERYKTPPSYLNGYKYVWTTNFENELTLSLPIYSGGKLESQIDQAKLNLQVADLNVEAIKQQLKQSITTYYFNVLQSRNEWNVSQETVDNYSNHLKNVRLQYDVGMVAKSDVLASEVSLANAQNTLIKAANNYELAIATLNNAMSLPLDSELQLEENLTHEKYTVSLEECTQYALEHRPEMAEYQAKITSALDDIKIAQSGRLPSVSFVATQDWYDNELPGSGNSNWYVGLTASQSIFDSGLTKSKIKQAQSGLDATREEARQKRDTILLEVRQYYLSMQEADKRIETSQVAVKQAQENLRIAEIRYNAGVGTNLDVLDAVLSLNEAKMNYIQAGYDYDTNKAQLDRAMGVAVE
jgi:outer membrane protein TolC